MVSLQHKEEDGKPTIIEFASKDEWFQFLRWAASLDFLINTNNCIKTKLERQTCKKTRALDHHDFWRCIVLRRDVCQMRQMMLYE
jgi:hypothetical protein